MPDHLSAPVITQILSLKLLPETQTMNTPEDTLPLFGDTDDLAILMHREVHFGGNFAVMLDYYRRGGKGVMPEFEIKKIEDLAAEELRIGKNLAPLLLTAKEAEEIKAARDAYEGFRELYAVRSPKNKLPLLIADLILSEEEEPEKEIEAILSEKATIVPFLIDLIRSEDFYNPLFPGYGKAYKYAAQALGRIGDKRALIALFESIGRGDFFDDEVLLKALQAIGEPAKTFLLRVLMGKPFNEDNEKAAIALLAFKDDPAVTRSCLNFLKELDLKQEAALATYLILICEGITDPEERKEFEAFSKQASIPKDLALDFKAILEEWKA